jgi:hypothetical protein
VSVYLTKISVRFTADLIVSDGSDTNAYGEECEEGSGYTLESGWYSPDWSRWEVDESPTYAKVYTFDGTADCCHWDRVYDVADHEPGRACIVLWLSRLIADYLEGFPEDNGDGTVYSGESYSHPYKGKSIRPAMHVEGLDDHLDVIAEACKR